MPVWSATKYVASLPRNPWFRKAAFRLPAKAFGLHLSTLTQGYPAGQYVWLNNTSPLPSVRGLPWALRLRLESPVEGDGMIELKRLIALFLLFSWSNPDQTCRSSGSSLRGQALTVMWYLKPLWQYNPIEKWSRTREGKAELRVSRGRVLGLECTVNAK